MSVENNKICLTCRRNIRSVESDVIVCRCKIDGHIIGYIECMEGWCRRWAKDKSGMSSVVPDREEGRWMI